MAEQSYSGNLFVESNWGTYSTRLIGTWELTGQSTSENKSYIKLRMYFYYGGGASASGSGNSTYTIDGQTVTWNGYRVYPGYTYIQEKNIEVQHNADGTFPGRTVSISGGGYSNVSGCSGTGTITGIATIPRASQPSINTYPTNSPNFNIGDTITIHMNRKSSNFTHKVYFNYGSTNYLVAENVTNNCQFNTSIIANDLYDLIPTLNTYSNTISVKTYNGSTLIGTKTCNYNANVSNANPIFSQFEFEDVNEITTALTGDNQICINGYSNIKATISTVNKATALKSATMAKYRFSITNNTPTDIVYSDNESVSGIINNANNGVFNVYAIDSRQNSTLVTKLASEEIVYTPIALDKQNCKIERNDNRVGDAAVLTLNGTLWNDSFGDVTNSIVSVEYKLKKTNSSTWINGTTTIVPTVSDNTFTFTGQIASDNVDTSWDLDASYNVEITISDELSSSTVELILNSAVPTMCLDRDGVSIMGAYDSTEGGTLQLKGKDIEKIIDDIFKGTVLYQNTSSSSTNSVQLSDSSANYTYLEIFFQDSVINAFNSIKVYQANGKRISLSNTFNGSSGSNTQYKNATFDISGKNITLSSWYGMGQINSGSSSYADRTLQISIYRVVGYK